MSRNHNANPVPPARERAALGRLLRHIDEQCSRECGTIKSEADDTAWRVVAEARERAARMLREARRRERATVREQVRAEAARQRARLRNAWTDQRNVLTEHAMTRLRELLLKLWRDDPEARRHWLHSALRQAARTLPATQWRIEVPGAWEDEAARAATPDPIPGSPESLQWHGLDDLEAGVRIRAGHALLDMSVPGLLARPNQVAGRMLARHSMHPPELEPSES